MAPSGCTDFNWPSNNSRTHPVLQLQRKLMPACSQMWQKQLKAVVLDQTVLNTRRSFSCYLLRKTYPYIYIYTYICMYIWETPTDSKWKNSNILWGKQKERPREGTWRVQTAKAQKYHRKWKKNCVQVSKWRSCSKHMSEIVVCGPSLNHCMLKPRKTVKGPSALAVFRRQSSVLS